MASRTVTSVDVETVPLVRPATYAGALLVLALVSSGQYVAESLHDGTPVHPSAALGSSLLFWTAWGLVAPVATRLASTARRRLDPTARIVACALIVSAAAAAQIGVRRAISSITGIGAERTLAELFASHVYLNIGVATCLLGAIALIESRRAAQRARLRILTVERELAEAQLAMLRSRLHPHFLLNTLQGIAALTHVDPDRAESMLATLGELLRQVVQRPVDGAITLGEEIEFVQRYCALERMRFEERLSVAVDIEPVLRHVPIPPYLVQPLVENAIRHGIAPRARGGTISLTVVRRDDMLVVTVSDDGVGLRTPSAAAGAGVGLASIRSRLAQLHGAAGRLEVAPRPGGGTTSTLYVPWHG